jgi:hypothetical protein
MKQRVKDQTSTERQGDFMDNSNIEGIFFPPALPLKLGMK